MGEYYNWVNVDRREYISPCDFDFGNKLLESSAFHNPFLCALRELIDNEWKGTRFLFLGDEKELRRDSDNEVLNALFQHSVECGHEGLSADTLLESYRNISGWFCAAEKDVRDSIASYIKECNSGEDAINEYGIDMENPYANLFTRNGKDYLYTINHTQKVFYSSSDTSVFIPDFSRYREANCDPLPFLMRFGNRGLGEWVGDEISVSDSRPDNYSFMEKITIEY